MKKQKNPGLRIKIKNCQRKITINKQKLSLLAEQVLKLKGIERAQVGILFVGRQRIRTLNQKFRKVDRVTDVLAFQMRQGKSVNSSFIAALQEPLGDIVICPDLAKKNAKIYNTTAQSELKLYLIHGILHLLGFCDTSLKDRRRMEKEQLRISRKLP